MVSRKGDISVNTIVYVAIAVFILIIIIGFATGTFQGLIKGIWSPSDVDNYKTECERMCAEAENAVESQGIGAWGGTDYCTKKYLIDLDENAKTPSVQTSCWATPISKACTATKIGTDGKTHRCTTDKTIDGSISAIVCIACKVV